MKKRSVAANAAVLAMSGIAAKLFDFGFRAYYSRRLGTEGVGLLSLGFSLHGVLLTVSTAGLGVAVSKVVSEYAEIKNVGAVRECMRIAVGTVLFLSLPIILLIFAFSDGVALRVLGDERVSVCLCALVPSVLFMGVSYCLKGYFYAQRKALPPASSEIVEQIIKFAAIKTLTDIFLPLGTEAGCAAVFAGISLGELGSCAYLIFFYILEERRDFGLSKLNNVKEEVRRKEIVCRILSVSIPSMMTSLFCSVFRTKEEVMVVSELERGGRGHSEALAALGTVYGMAMPLLVLPLNLMGSVLSLLVPEISRASVCGEFRLKRVTYKIYKFGIAAGLSVSAFFILFGEKVSIMFYNSLAAAEMTICMAPLCVIMFIDSFSSSILNGLGKQCRLFIFSAADFALRFTLIHILIPRGGINAFPAVIAASNIFTAVLSFTNAVKIVCGGAKILPRKLTKSNKYGILKGRN